MTTTYLVPLLGRVHQIDSDGDPLSGALLYVYQHTTTTAVSLFSDSAGSTTAANPIVADSTGRFEPRYTTYGNRLTLVLKTSAGVTVWTSDDIYPLVHSGGVAFTGNLSIEKANATVTVDATSGNATYVLDREAGNSAIISGRTAGEERWRGIFGNATAEAGANAGSDLVFQAFDDDGVSIGNAIVVTRATLAAALGGALSVAGVSALTGAVTSASSIKSTSATAGLGYATGAGGAVTQGTDKSTTVVLNKICGQITMHNATLNAAAEATFTLTNSTIAATDVVLVNVATGATAGTYTAVVDAVAAGSCRITVGNHSGSNQGEAIVLNFIVLKGVAA